MLYKSLTMPTGIHSHSCWLAHWWKHMSDATWSQSHASLSLLHQDSLHLSLSHPLFHLRCQEDHPDWWEVEFPKLHVTLKVAQFSWHQLHPLTSVRWPVFSLPLQHRILEGRDSISYSFQLPSVISCCQMDEQNVQPILHQVTQCAGENIKN